jgi:serine/threonine protein kinase
MQSHLSGEFLNGQSLYLKAALKDRSVDEREGLTLDSFEVIKMIGSGGFSKVYLCRFKRDGNFYAMKVIDKDVIVKNKKKNIIMN